MDVAGIINTYITNHYVRGAIVFACLAILFRLLLFIARKTFIFLTSKTKTDLDDLFVEKLSGPFSLLSILLALGISVPIFDLGADVTSLLNNVVYSVVIVVFAVVVHHFVNILFFTSLKRVAKKSKTKVDDTLFSIFNSILNVVLIIVSFLYILSLWGVEIGPLLAGLGIAGLAVALALQPILSNIFSGIAVVLDGTVKTGDLVYLEGESIKGKIDRIGLRSTRVLTFDNEYIIVPNNKLSDSAVQNIALPEPKSRVVIPFGVAYGSNIEKVKKLIEKELKKVNHLDKEEPISVKFLEMADSSLNFKAFFYVESYAHRFAATDQANTLIYNALNKAKISIPFPQMDVHVKK